MIGSHSTKVHTHTPARATHTLHTGTHAYSHAYAQARIEHIHTHVRTSHTHTRHSLPVVAGGQRVQFRPCLALTARLCCEGLSDTFAFTYTHAAPLFACAYVSIPACILAHAINCMHMCLFFRFHTVNVYVSMRACALSVHILVPYMFLLCGLDTYACK